MGTIQINYRIDEALLNRVKTAAKAKGVKYTSWMIDACIAYLEGDSKIPLNNSNSEIVVNNSSDEIKDLQKKVTALELKVESNSNYNKLFMDRLADLEQRICDSDVLLNNSITPNETSSNNSKMESGVLVKVGSDRNNEEEAIILTGINKSETTVEPTNDESHIEEKTETLQGIYEGVVADPYWVGNCLIDKSAPITKKALGKKLGIDYQRIDDYETKTNYKPKKQHIIDALAILERDYIKFEDNYYWVLERKDLPIKSPSL